MHKTQTWTTGDKKCRGSLLLFFNKQTSLSLFMVIAILGNRGLCLMVTSLLAKKCKCSQFKNHSTSNWRKSEILQKTK